MSRRPSPTHRGFTLLETVLAVGLTVVMLGVLLTMYRRASDVQQRLEADIALVNERRQVMRLLTDELRHAMTNRLLQMGLEGGPFQVQFITATLPGPAAWAVRDATDDPVPVEFDQQIVGYRLRYVEDDEGYFHIAGLERTAQKRLAIAVVDEEDDVEATLISPSIRFIAFRYFDGTQFLDQWSGGDLPMGVEIVLGREPIGEDMELEEYLELHETHRRLVYVPGGRQALGGTVVRGLGGGR